jgi:hypothetical protein
VEAHIYAAEFEGEDGGCGEEGSEVFFGLGLAKEFADVGAVCVSVKEGERGEREVYSTSMTLSYWVDTGQMIASSTRPLATLSSM